MKKIPWWQPLIGKKEYALVKHVLKSNFPNEGRMTDAFQEELAKLLHVKYVIAVPSGTVALFLALKAFNIGQGDEVIVPDVSFIATANAVEMTGAKAVLVDVDKLTATIDPARIQQAITKKTKAIVPVHVSGRAAQMSKILTIAKKRNLPVIEDAAEALLSKHEGKFLGTFGDIGCFSLAPTKTITTGQGGFIATNNKSLFLKIKLLKDQGRPERGSGGDDVHYGLGYNFKFSNVNAAVGLGQLSYVQARIKKMKRNFLLYKKLLLDVKEVSFYPFNIKQGEFPLWIDVKTKKRDQLYDFLAKNGADCRKFWYPIHTQEYYKESDRNFPNSIEVCSQTLWLPSAFTLTENDVIKVSNLIRSFFKYRKVKFK